VFNEVKGRNLDIYFTHANAYVRCVYFDQVTLDKGKPVVECQPAYQPVAIWLDWPALGAQMAGSANEARRAM
jgi:hypothetical protein